MSPLCTAVTGWGMHLKGLFHDLGRRPPPLSLHPAEKSPPRRTWAGVCPQGSAVKRGSPKLDALKEPMDAQVVAYMFSGMSPPATPPLEAGSPA